MKKKVLLLAIVALMLTVFDSVPAYAKEAGVAGREEKEAFEAQAKIEKMYNKYYLGPLSVFFKSTKFKS